MQFYLEDTFPINDRLINAYRVLHHFGQMLLDVFGYTMGEHVSEKSIRYCIHYVRPQILLDVFGYIMGEHVSEIITYVITNTLHLQMLLDVFGYIVGEHVSEIITYDITHTHTHIKSSDAL